MYDKHECMIVGFVGCGDVNNVLLAFERSRSGDADHTMVKHMLIFMVHGILSISSFHMPNIHTADMLYRDYNINVQRSQEFWL